MTTATRLQVQLRAKTINGREGELTRVYLHCECGKELASWPVETLVRGGQVNYARCARCRELAPPT